MATPQLAANAVATLAQFQSYFGASDLTNEVQLMYFNAACASLESYLGYEFYRQAVTAEKHEASGDQKLVLRRFPLISVTEVRYNGTALAATDYDVDTDSGIVQILSPQWYGSYQPSSVNTQRPLKGSERQLYQVDYEAGWVTSAQSEEYNGTYEDDPITLPYDIMVAGLALASLQMQQHKLAGAGIPTRERIGDAEIEFSSSIRRGAGATQASMQQGMPDWIATRLGPYRRVRIA